jgi:hypothetical protein
LFATGKAYLTGPYNGAPFGLSVAVPAKAGPFNPGNVIVRAKSEVDPHTAQVTVTSDPLPQIIDGIETDIRTIYVTIDGPGFTFNPTNCNPVHHRHDHERARRKRHQTVPGHQLRTLTAKPGCDPSHAKHSGALEELTITKPRTPPPKQFPALLKTLQKACTTGSSMPPCH